MDLLKNIIQEKYFSKLGKQLVFNFLENSDKNAVFYNEQFKKETELAEKKSEILQPIKSLERDKTIDEIPILLQKKLHSDAILIELGGSVYQQRSGNLYQKFKNYFPLDISFSSMNRYAKEFKRMAFVADAEVLPFKNNSIDCIYTHDFLEHPSRPDLVLAEINRVLKPGGLVLHNDAWFCRWWQRFGIVGIKKFTEQNLKEKLIFIAAKITEFPLFRFPIILSKRFFKTLFFPKPKNINFEYKKLKPNYDLMLSCDEDAASSIDPLDVIRYYESRGFELEKPLNFKQRILFRQPYIILRKK